MNELKLDRSGGKLLSSQLVQQLKAAIRRGDYGPGAVLPGAVELAAAADVGEKTARRALSVLSREGWTVPKRHVGSVVVERGLPTLCRKRILFFTPWYSYCYYSDQLLAEVRYRLMRGRDGVSVMMINGCRGKHRSQQLEEALKERWDLVVEIGQVEETRRIIETSNWPFLVVSDGAFAQPSSSKNAVGFFDIQSKLALPDVMKACARGNVHSVLQFLGDPKPPFDVTGGMEMMGVAVHSLRIHNPGTPEGIARGGFVATRDWFLSHKGAYPDLVLFTDDYIAQGGLIALKSLGVRIPEDVAVISLANKGHGPIWEKTLTRLEMNPVAHGKVLAKEIAAYLRCGMFAQGVVLGSKWVAGATF